MRTLLLACLSLLSAAVGAPAFAQQPATFAETPKSKRLDETYLEATASAKKTYERAREKETGAWIRSYERALSAAKASGDEVAVAYLSRAIALTKQAGFVVKPAPPDAQMHEGHGYLFLQPNLTFHAARKRCEELGGHLVTIESPSEADFLVKTWGDRNFWIGAGDFAEEGNYRWINGTPFEPHGYATRFGNWRGFRNALSWSTEHQQWSDGASEGYLLEYICEWDQ
ncbi:MAG TPA: C-type lectin domain-containing protein [Pirellulaceae bacterium]|jgi:hypothetical protein|nr:C-type lectin domain-containing protein [Pirellulaceae bacterium]